MKDTVKFEDFSKLDLRVGEVVEAEDPEWSRSLLKLTVDLGEVIGRRTIFAGVKGIYEPEWFVGKKGVFVANLAPKKMGGEESQGMMLMSVEVDEEGKDTKIVPIEIDGSVENGTIVR